MNEQGAIREKTKQFFSGSGREYMRHGKQPLSTKNDVSYGLQKVATLIWKLKNIMEITSFSIADIILKQKLNIGRKV